MIGTIDNPLPAKVGIAPASESELAGTLYRSWCNILTFFVDSLEQANAAWAIVSAMSDRMARMTTYASTSLSIYYPRDLFTGRMIVDALHNAGIDLEVFSHVEGSWKNYK